MDVGTISIVLVVSLLFLLAIGMPLGLASAVVLQKADPCRAIHKAHIRKSVTQTDETRLRAQEEHLIIFFLFRYRNNRGNLQPP